MMSKDLKKDHEKVIEHKHPAIPKGSLIKGDKWRVGLYGPRYEWDGEHWVELDKDSDA